MAEKFKVFFSNRTECLVERLKERLFAPPSTPFSRRLIIVPSPAMKAWLMLQMANDPEMGIAAGLEIAYLDQTLKQLQAVSHPVQSKQLNSLEIALALESEIRSIIENFQNITEHSVWAPLMEYLKAAPGRPLSRKSERRLTKLCDTLARQFGQYGVYGGKLLEAWETNSETGWQQMLWNKLFAGTNWSYPYRDISSAIGQIDTAQLQDVQIHLFAISYLSKLHHAFLSDLGNHVPLTYYLLSPCQAFWTDLVTDRQSIRLQSYWKDKGVSQTQQLELEEYLRNRNALLANFGRIGREMATHIEDSGALTGEEYIIDTAAADYPQYDELIHEDILLEEKGNPLSLLHAVQADMTLLRTPSSREKIEIDHADSSVQVHAASSKMREMEILYTTFMGIIDAHRHDEVPICPGDIIVMIPDIQSYIPYIKAVFHSKESALDAQIMDLPVPASSGLIQSFLHLLSLPLGRWDVSSILQLFDSRHFQKRHQFSSEDMRQIREWVKDTGARWGGDFQHRNELLQRDHGKCEMVESTSVGTWEHAIARILSGLALTISDNQEASNQSAIAPFEEIEALEGDLLGKWIATLRALRKDLQFLHDGTELSLTEWSQYLRCLADAYFAQDYQNEEGNNHDTLKGHIAAFAYAAQTIGDQKIPFSSLRHHLESGLNQQVSCYRENALHAVRFCALLPMRAIPAKVIAMAGMHAGAFPRQEANDSLDLMKSDPRADYCPSCKDYDRFLFLETILSARSYLLLSYQGYSDEDGKEQMPSLLITELLAYLDKSYTVGGKTPTERCVYKHPFFSFDRAYFTEGSALTSYSESHFKAAQAYYRNEKTIADSFIPEFTAAGNEQNDDVLLDIQDLSSFARNPLKTYFNKTLGIYLPKDEDRQIKNDEDFHLSRLQSHILTRDAFQRPIEDILIQAEKEGRLPIGPFKPFAINSIKREVETLKANLKSLGVAENEIFSIYCSEQCQKPECDKEGNWHVPPLLVEYKNKHVKIIGKFCDITPKGMIAKVKEDGDYAKCWPQFLILSSLIEKFWLPIDKQLLIYNKDNEILSKPALEDSFSLLQDYLEYYFTALEHASPLVPEWLPKILSKDAEEFQGHLKDSLNNPFKPFYNEYAKWVVKDGDLPIHVIERLYEHWKPRAEKVFGKIFQHWVG